MNITSGGVYHIYNRGNNRQQIFFDSADYLNFLSKVKSLWKPISDILCYCLMPNHFHFMIQVRAEGSLQVPSYSQNCPTFNRKVGTVLSSYTQYFNKKYERLGSLFQQKTKSICLNDFSVNDFSVPHLITCMHYIHQNPLRARLVTKLEDWEYSSFKDYAGLRNGSLCTKEILKSLTDFDDFFNESYAIMNEKLVTKFFGRTGSGPGPTDY